ncbi:cationic amino acid transporter 4-like isoform X1 [Styela clava]
MGTSLCFAFWKAINRKKTLTEDLLQTDLKKCLNLVDLTFLAIGSMVGSGLYVMTGTIAHNVAGPSVIISYIIAAVASGLSAICYAEFGARIPITGSAYQFTYISIGEFWAFIIGWNVLIEHIVVGSAVAKAWSGYLDAAFGNVVQNYLLQNAPMADGGMFARYPDLIAIAVLIIITVILATGAKISSLVTTGFAGLNLLIVVIIIGTGFYLGDTNNWTDVDGGFFPYGFSGTMSGAASLIFAYAGYEAIGTATEEALNPNRDIPLSLLIGLSVVATAYVGASASLTYMIPYNMIYDLAPFPNAYIQYGWNWARYIVSIGALAAMTTAMLTSLFTVPRYFLAMSRDGLLMEIFARVNEKTKVPIFSIVTCGLVCVLFAFAFEVDALVEFVSIGQLIACTFVAICVIKLRYQPNSITRFMDTYTINENQSDASEKFPLMSHVVKTSEKDETKTQSASSLSSKSEVTLFEETGPNVDQGVGSVKAEILSSKFGFLFQPLVKFEAGEVPNYLLILATFAITVTSALGIFTQDYISSWWNIALIFIFSSIATVSILLLLVFKQDESIKTFKVPGVPFVPFLSAIINIILILKLQPMTWLRLGIWCILGLAIYFGYGYNHSAEGKRR